MGRHAFLAVVGEVALQTVGHFAAALHTSSGTTVVDPAKLAESAVARTEAAQTVRHRHLATDAGISGGQVSVAAG